MKNELWGTDEFEDLIERGIIALYESTHSKWGKVGPRVRIKPDELARLKKIGLYFAPGDRMSPLGHVDIANDGLPNYGVMSFKATQFDRADDLLTKQKIAENQGVSGYLMSYWCTKWKNNILPKRWASMGSGLLYAVYALAAREEGGLIGYRRFVRIDPSTGGISNCYQPYQYWDGVKYVETYTEKGDDDAFRNDVAIASFSLGFYSDRKNFWNVTTTEDNNKNVHFGVYEEQIQSLFYARNLPMTATGRKRPILHWVAAHKRRVKQGTPVDVKKHMRGITAFEMNGTSFEITQPLKKAA